VAFFDTDDGLLAIMVGGSVAEWQAALDAAEPVLESVEVWTQANG
jgi:microcompartment protein CcmL/EutN